MTRRGGKQLAISEIFKRIDADLIELAKIAGTPQRRTSVSQKIDSLLRGLTARTETLVRELDPINWPRFVFDPGDPAVVGRFIAIAMIAQPRTSLSDIQRFHGSGVYALYYEGEFAPYAPISGTETPIYVGKADPAEDTARTPTDQGIGLHTRLDDHMGNISKAKDTLDIADFTCRFLVVQTGWQNAAETYLIDLFRPVWNSETGICYGLGKHGDKASTRTNRRSPWDTLHPGRKWAGSGQLEDARSREQIVTDLKTHFSTATIYCSVDQILEGFFDELRQL